jgi:hypothetical protein
MKLKVGICSFSYGGNGGIRSEVPDVRDWMLDVFREVPKDTRISSLVNYELSDTPITMTRNRAVVEARKNKLDVLVMVDSDMQPDCEPGAPPFFQTAFNFLYESYDRGPVVIGAPYCGPTPCENVYVFQWNSLRNDQANPNHRLSQFSREEAARKSGIHPVAALPTGLIMYDMRIFDLLEPKNNNSKPWFYYEWTDKYAANKASTEDVTATRDMSLVGQKLLGYNPVYCAWDCWAGHWKPHLVRKPQILTVEQVGNKYAEALASGIRADEKEIYVHEHLNS